MTEHGAPNRLIREKSPYLLQHAHNPVDWHPWGEEAFAKARAEEKPILLSIGYSTCHWCHVMEQESFEDPGIAGLMNKWFISIKLDREERPDVDKIYMTAVQAMTGQGGWPLNVFLTPELKPFYGGTYFPPEPRRGQPGFARLLERIAELWRTQRADLEKDAGSLTAAVGAYVAGEAKPSELRAEWLDRALAAYRGSFDPEHGGFGSAPKFPMPVYHHFLLRYYARTGNREALDLCLVTLRRMARGGICDQIGGGFHRYSTDAEWRVPHFEKMLYDNAQLAAVYLEAFQVSGDPEMALVARETLDYLLRDMRHSEGGFFSAEDADSLEPETGRKEEGAFYLWSEVELRNVLGADTEPFIRYFGVEPSGKRILHAGPSSPRPDLGQAKARLLAARAARPRPGLDDKVLVSWNGLAISAFAKAWLILEEPQYLAAAQVAAGFIRKRLYDSDSKHLWRRWRGEAGVPAMADDYAFLAQGLLDLYEADFDHSWLDWAMALAEEQNRLFLADQGGFYLTAEGHDKNLILRAMDDSDNVEPSASSIGALNLLRLHQFTRRKDFLEAAEKTLRRFGPLMERRPLSLAAMLSALSFHLSKPRQIVIAGAPGMPGYEEMLRTIRSRFLPEKITALARHMPFPEAFAPKDGKTLIYICAGGVCELPIMDAALLRKTLDALLPKA
ncbi:MAG: thioredoxin domain-containing protein [Elusimicrobia bacterium]|nr:thioredoxin domain-containing protein [Elusimicrobiota bacterium]